MFEVIFAFKNSIKTDYTTELNSKFKKCPHLQNEIDGF